MSSTKPTTSASGVLRGGVAIVIAALALFTIYETGRGLLGANNRVRGAAALAAAERLPRGAARDSELARAQEIARSGVSLAPDDEDLWNLLAETRLMQATTAAATAISNTLLSAAADASARAAALEPKDPAPPARIAFVRALQEDGKSEVGAALAQSYTASAFDPSLGARRVEAAARAWTALNESVRNQALLEACQLARRGDSERKNLYDLRMGPADPGMALALDRIMSDPSCAVRS